MSDPNLHQLEREVEAARARLAGDLSTLRSPATYSEFSSELKYEALEMKDTLVDKAKSSVQSTIEELVDDLKAKAAANPAATLAIGAGIAWRLIQKPPIATALIGAGLYSLLRTPPMRPNGRRTSDYIEQAKGRLAEQASELAETVKERAVAASHVATEKAAELAAGVKERASALGEAASEKASDLASTVRHRAMSMTEAASDKAGELAGAARGHAEHWSEEMRSSVRELADNAAGMTASTSRTLEDMKQSSMREAGRVASRASAMSDEWTRPIQEMAGNPETRDRLLLGAAGVAVIAALGIACQRSMTERAES